MLFLQVVFICLYSIVSLYIYSILVTAINNINLYMEVTQEKQNYILLNKTCYAYKVNNVRRLFDWFFACHVIQDILE
jgi:hypothetical protein